MDQLKQDTKFMLEECYNDIDKISDLDEGLEIKHTVTDLMLRLKELTNQIG
jgi:hypothetical protein